jgi:hypothetical protein
MRTGVIALVGGHDIDACGRCPLTVLVPHHRLSLGSWGWPLAQRRWLWVWRACGRDLSALSLRHLTSIRRKRTSKMPYSSLWVVAARQSLPSMFWRWWPGPSTSSPLSWQSWLRPRRTSYSCCWIRRRRTGFSTVVHRCMGQASPCFSGVEPACPMQLRRRSWSRSMLSYAVSQPTLVSHPRLSGFSEGRAGRVLCIQTRQRGVICQHSGFRCSACGRIRFLRQSISSSLALLQRKLSCRPSSVASSTLLRWP